ncbi:putative ankyrin repeat-containing domain superfamily [Septoria linicola]|nr:putative ankyrin repeat-containing domain superfamily [Septoria linicola]
MFAQLLAQHNLLDVQYQLARMDIRQLVDHGPLHEKISAGPASRNVLPDWQESVRTGDLRVLKDICTQLQADHQALPLHAMLKAALDGRDAEMLKFLFGQGALMDPGLDTISVKEDRRPLYFFRVLVDNGWPTGIRGMTNNLGHGRGVVELLLEHGRIVGVPCLQAAVRTGDVEVLAVLIQNIDPRAKVPNVADYESALYDPGYWTSPNMFSEEPSLTRIIDQASLLQLAALYQELDMVRYLLGLKASVDLTPLPDQSPEGVNGCALHKSVSSAVVGKVPQPELVQVLLDVGGADPLLQDELGRTALEINEGWGHPTTKDAIRSLLLGAVDR